MKFLLSKNIFGNKFELENIYYTNKNPNNVEVKIDLLKNSINCWMMKL